jgi:phosphatidylinositol glycan class B
MLAILTPLFLLGVYFTKCWQPFLVILWILLAYSKNLHKEFRFALPAMPLAFMYCGYALNWIQYRHQILRTHNNQRMYYDKAKKTSLLFKLLLCLILVVNVSMIFYFSLFHQRAPISVVSYLAEHGSNEAKKLNSVHFLTGCHSTPFYSHIHHPVSLRQLDCSPK